MGLLCLIMIIVVVTSFRILISVAKHGLQVENWWAQRTWPSEHHHILNLPLQFSSFTTKLMRMFPCTQLHTDSGREWSGTFQGTTEQQLGSDFPLPNCICNNSEKYGDPEWSLSADRTHWRSCENRNEIRFENGEWWVLVALFGVQSPAPIEVYTKITGVDSVLFVLLGLLL